MVPRAEKSSPEKRKRIIALDLLRGFLLLVVMIDHFGWFPSPFELLSGRGSLWASAAEGFFIISGLLVGYIYTPRIRRSFKATTLKLWRRGLLLYVWAVLLTLAFTWWGQHIGGGHKPIGLWENPPLGQFLFQAFTLQYVYGWADFLQYYAVYMMVAPLALWLCSRSLGWLVLALSAAICVPSHGYLASWQLLFMVGMVAGYYLPGIQEWYRRLPRRRSRLLAAGVGTVAVATMLFSALTDRVAIYFMDNFAQSAAVPAWLHTLMSQLYAVHTHLLPWTDKASLGPLRLAAALVWFVALYLFIRRYEQRIDRWSRGLLRTLGENSLVVYVLQAVLVFAALAYIGQGWSLVVNTALTAGGLLLAYGLVRLWLLLAPRLQQRTHDGLLLALLAIVAGIGAWQAAWAPARVLPQAATAAVRAPAQAGAVIKDVPYCNGQLLDIYQPRNVVFRRSPVVMYLHGGGWIMNDKASETDQLAMVDGLRDKGYAIVSINYRQLPTRGYPAAVQDTLCAVRYVRAHAVQYRFDRQQLAAYGFSAGGYLAAMAGSLPDNSTFAANEPYGAYSSRVSAVVTLAGLFDFTDGLTSENQTTIGNFLQGADPQTAQAITYVSPDDPPFLLVHGAADQYVPLAQDARMAETLDRNHVPHQQLVVEHAEHGLNPAGGEPSPSRHATAQAMDAFIQKALGE